MRARCGRMNSPLVLNTRSTARGRSRWWAENLLKECICNKSCSLRSPWRFSRTWTAEDEDKDKDKDFWFEDKDKDKDLSLKDEDKDKDLKIGPRGQGLSSRTTTLKATAGN